MSGAPRRPMVPPADTAGAAAATAAACGFCPRKQRHVTSPCLTCVTLLDPPRHDLQALPGRAVRGAVVLRAQTGESEGEPDWEAEMSIFKVGGPAGAAVRGPASRQAPAC